MWTNQSKAFYVFTLLRECSFLNRILIKKKNQQVIKKGMLSPVNNAASLIQASNQQSLKAKLAQSVETRRLNQSEVKAPKRALTRMMPHIPSFIEFSKQLDRPDMHEGLVGASEERFNYMPRQEDMRFRRPAATDFSKWKPMCLDEYLNQAIVTTKELNAFN